MRRIHTKLWKKIERNEDETYSLSGLKGKIRAPMKDLLKSGVISKKELRDLIMKMPVDKENSLADLLSIALHDKIGKQESR